MEKDAFFFSLSPSISMDILWPKFVKLVNRKWSLSGKMNFMTVLGKASINYFSSFDLRVYHSGIKQRSKDEGDKEKSPSGKSDDGIILDPRRVSHSNSYT